MCTHEPHLSLEVCLSHPPTLGPGYYNIDPTSTTDRDFGVRLTNVMRVIPSETPVSLLDRQGNSSVSGSEVHNNHILLVFKLCLIRVVQT